MYWKSSWKDIVVIINLFLLQVNNIKTPHAFLLILGLIIFFIPLVYIHHPYFDSFHSNQKNFKGVYKFISIQLTNWEFKSNQLNWFVFFFSFNLIGFKFNPNQPIFYFTVFLLFKLYPIFCFGEGKREEIWKYQNDACLLFWFFLF